MLVDATERRVFRDGWPEGWSVRDETGEDHLAVWLDFHPGKSGANPVSRKVWNSFTCDSTALGQMTRMLAVWGGIARYLNAGGSPDVLSDLLTEFCSSDLPLLDPPGFHLLNTEQEIDYVRHSFISDDERTVVVWDEGASVEIMPIDEYGDRIDEEEAELDEEDDDEFQDGIG